MQNDGEANVVCQLEIHIGYVYGDKETPPNASNFTPKFVTGARLPHAWIKPRTSTAALDLPPVDLSYVSDYTKDDVAARTYSTLDLAGTDNFTLIVSSKAAWAERFQQLQNAVKEINGQLQLWAMDTDFEFVDAKQQDLFEKGVHLSQGGALLVRPDQHLLGCPGSQTSAQDLESLIRSHLGL